MVAPAHKEPIWRQRQSVNAFWRMLYAVCCVLRAVDGLVVADKDPTQGRLNPSRGGESR